jgi:hypothetical protein
VLLLFFTLWGDEEKIKSTSDEAVKKQHLPPRTSRSGSLAGGCGLSELDEGSGEGMHIRHCVLRFLKKETYKKSILRLQKQALSPPPDSH